ncbi:MAG: sulfatase [Cyclobacteriaceae bacterium]
MMEKLIKIVFCLFFLSFFSIGKAQDRPNIIFILTDDQRWDALGFAGNDIIQTPEMDRLAAEGTYFSHAIVTTPICAASRASLLCGLYERTHGYTFQQGPFKEPFWKMSYPVLLQQHGYYTGFFGKIGVTYPAAENYFDQAELYDRNNKYPDRRGYFYKTIGNDTVHLTRYTGQQALDFINSAPGGKPFCLSLSFSAPHAHDPAEEQYFWQDASDDLYNTTIPPPQLAEKKYFDDLPAPVRLGLNRERWYWRFDTPEKYQHSVKGYYRMITEIDREITKIRQLLAEKGIAENTVIMLMGDNGYYLGERQLAGKWLMHDNSIRVPLIIYDPRQDKPRQVDDMVLNIDIPYTILSMAGAKVPGQYQGVNLQPYLNRGKHKQNRDHVLVEHLWNYDKIPSSEGIRSEKWKYFRYRLIDAPEELYNLQEDPRETKNLASEPKYQKVLEGMRSKCEKKILQYLP